MFYDHSTLYSNSPFFTATRHSSSSQFTTTTTARRESEISMQDTPRPSAAVLPVNSSLGKTAVVKIMGYTGDEGGKEGVDLEKAEESPSSVIHQV